MSKTAVIYWSGTGNTAAMANAVAAGIDGAEVFSVSDFDRSKVNEYDKFAFGCPSMGTEVLEENEFEPFFEGAEKVLKGKKVALFGSYGWGDGEWMKEWENRVKNDGAQLFEKGLTVNNEPDDDELNQCTEFGNRFMTF